MSMPLSTAWTTVRKNVTAILVAGISVLATTQSAFAHPHVWIDANAEFVFEDNNITAVHVHWVFDDLFSMTLIDEFDQNYDTRFFGEENTAIRDNAFTALSEFSWLTHLRKNEELVSFAGATDFVADITDDRRVTYDFKLMLETPLDPIRDAVSLSVYDAEYYIDVAYTQVDPVLFSGAKNLSCHFEMSEDEKNRIYFDLVAPVRADVVCAAKVADGSSSNGLAPGDFVLVE
ncbi:DUF1007 family protein [Thalassospira sp. HF15]|uniref:DUF1007 family protein n=1 Tax=Thalassospira sp. HF15 TaxID=2722755 RepID=UPI00142F6083|nr:DUF1007 family protein [Thalassospira sp. HF15]NIY76179.1 DUF1007 family protein [Thalassospira sp. HF15]